MERGLWGSWRNEEKCGDDRYVYGLQVKSERGQGGSDDTGLNGVRLHCKDGGSIKSGEQIWGEWTDSRYEFVRRKTNKNLSLFGQNC